MTDGIRSAAVGAHPVVGVVDYGVNNIGSVLNMLRRLDVDATPVRRPEDLATATALILPGIGAFDAGVNNLKRAGLFEALQRLCAGPGVPLLGICLGMQLLGRGSDEGTLEGLGLIDARSHRLSPDSAPRRLKIPHMGWNEVEPVDAELFSGFDNGAPRFYFVHSYHLVCTDPRDVAARCSYGSVFTAGVRRGTVMGTQFHPEKSHAFGMRIIQNFVRIATGKHA